MWLKPLEISLLLEAGSISEESLSEQEAEANTVSEPLDMWSVRLMDGQLVTGQAADPYTEVTCNLFSLLFFFSFFFSYFFLLLSFIFFFFTKLLVNEKSFLIVHWCSMLSLHPFL